MFLSLTWLSVNNKKDAILSIPKPTNTCFKNKAKPLLSIFAFSEGLNVLYPAIRSGYFFTKKPQIIRVILTKS